MDNKFTIRCLDCGTKLRTIESECEITVTVHTDFEDGWYPVDICPNCWSFYRDKTKKTRDNPNSMANVGL